MTDGKYFNQYASSWATRLYNLVSENNPDLTPDEIDAQAAAELGSMDRNYFRAIRRGDMLPPENYTNKVVYTVSKLKGDPLY